jgi:hypothetical protein
MEGRTKSTKTPVIRAPTGEPKTGSGCPRQRAQAGSCDRLKFDDSSTRGSRRRPDRKALDQPRHNGGDETGNASSYSYQPAASDAAVRHAGARAARRNGLDAYAMDRRPHSNSAPRARMAVDSDDPALTGGGSIGYNELLQQEGN